MMVVILETEMGAFRATVLKTEGKEMFYLVVRILVTASHSVTSCVRTNGTKKRPR